MFNKEVLSKAWQVLTVVGGAVLTLNYAQRTKESVEELLNKKGS